VLLARRCWIVAVVPVVLVTACGDVESPSASSEATLEGWCATVEETLPALASPNPDGRELEVLDLYIDRYEQLAEGRQGVPASASTAMGDLAGVFRDVRDRVVSGEPLPAVLSELWGDAESGLLRAGSVASEEAAAICPDT
jgi:hypothetical protein